MEGRPERGSRHRSRGRSAPLESTILGLTPGFTVGSFVIQFICLTFFFASYCGIENTGDAHQALCRNAQEGGYLPLLLLPPLSVVLGGLVAAVRLKRSILNWTFCAATALGVGIPLIAALSAGTV